MKKDISSLKEKYNIQISLRDAEAEALRRQLQSLSESRDAEMRKAVHKALCDQHSKFVERLDEVKTGLKQLKGVHLGPLLASKEIGANLLLLKELETKKEFNLEEEMKLLSEDPKSGPNAETAFNAELAGILKLLRFPSPAPIAIEDGMKGSSLELASAEVGVHSQFGSNFDSYAVDTLLAEERQVSRSPPKVPEILTTKGPSGALETIPENPLENPEMEKESDKVPPQDLEMGSGEKDSEVAAEKDPSKDLGMTSQEGSGQDTETGAAVEPVKEIEVKTPRTSEAQDLNEEAVKGLNPEEDPTLAVPADEVDPSTNIQTPPAAASRDDGEDSKDGSNHSDVYEKIDFSIL